MAMAYANEAGKAIPEMTEAMERSLFTDLADQSYSL